MALMLCLAAGRQRIVLLGDGYYNTGALAVRLRPHGAEPVLVDLLDPGAVERELRASAAQTVQAHTERRLRASRPKSAADQRRNGLL